MSRLVSRALLLALLAVAVLAPAARAEWTTYHADPGRSGVDWSAGSPVPFGAAWQSAALGGRSWSEPLVHAGLVIVATQSNDVIALSAASGQVVWRTNAGTPVPSSALPCGNISPTVGITGTPVLDPATNTVYAVADLWDGSHATHELIALDAQTGAERFRRGVDPSGSQPLNQLQREGLALDGGRVLIGYGGNDGDCAQYKGYLVNAPANNAGPNGQYQVPTTRGGAIWSGGGAPAIDAAGSVYVPTGNAASSDPNNYDHGDTLEKLDPAGNQLDSFAPSSWAKDSGADADLGSVATQLLPGGLAYQGGKNGNGYLVNTARLGGIGGELYSAPVCNSFGADAYANGVIYVACSGGVRALSLDVAHARFAKLWQGPSDATGPPIVAGGLVWVTAPGQGMLYGLDPQSGAVRVRQSTPAMEHFITPAASDGRLFLGTGDTVQAYTIGTGLPASSPASGAPLVKAPATSPALRCTGRLALGLRAPRRDRVVDARVLLGGRTVAHRGRGRGLTHMTFAAPSGRHSFTLRVVERTARGRRLKFTVVYRNCRRVIHHQRHPSRRARRAPKRPAAH